ncbi:MAG: hypothetical protein JST43_04785 [Bacteroidetes bacterium]|nr:hypothetical protein [Bacteroidota bacterium]MBS1539860.1 hypothetical protein [Bacteroidota bacterium]
MLGVLAVTAFTFLTMQLWNWLVPTLFNGPLVSFWQALGLLVLSKILFSGFGGRRHCRDHRWGGHWRGRWQNLTPEERARFKQKLKDKWCYRTPGDSSPLQPNEPQ